MKIQSASQCLCRFLTKPNYSWNRDPVKLIEFSFAVYWMSSVTEVNTLNWSQLHSNSFTYNNYIILYQLIDLWITGLLVFADLIVLKKAITAERETLHVKLISEISFSIYWMSSATNVNFLIWSRLHSIIYNNYIILFQLTDL